MTLVQHDVPWQAAVVLSLLAGALVGACQGLWIAHVGILSFIVTPAGTLPSRSRTQILLQGQSIAPFPRGFRKIRVGFLPAIGPNTNYRNLTLVVGLAVIVFALVQQVRQRRVRLRYCVDALPFTWFLAECLGIVAVALVFTLLLASCWGARCR